MRETKQVDAFRELMKKHFGSGDGVGGMERKCLECGQFIPMYTEQSDQEHGGRPYYVDAIDHICEERESHGQ